VPRGQTVRLRGHSGAAGATLAYGLPLRRVARAVPRAVARLARTLSTARADRLAGVIAVRCSQVRRTTPTRPTFSNFFEQAERCYHCGRQRFVTVAKCSCDDGWWMHDDLLPEDMLCVLTTGGGLSSA
jgi:hypothetical protein